MGRIGHEFEPVGAAAHLRSHHKGGRRHRPVSGSGGAPAADAKTAARLLSQHENSRAGRAAPAWLNPKWVDPQMATGGGAEHLGFIERVQKVRSKCFFDARSTHLLHRKDAHDVADPTILCRANSGELSHAPRSERMASHCRVAKAAGLGRWGAVGLD